MNPEAFIQIQVLNDKGIPFNIRLVSSGDNYYIEFYDARYIDTFDYLGQFICRYFATTLLEHDNDLLLYTDVEDWQLSKSNMNLIRDWLLLNM